MFDPTAPLHVSPPAEPAHPVPGDDTQRPNALASLVGAVAGFLALTLMLLVGVTMSAEGMPGAERAVPVPTQAFAVAVDVGQPAVQRDEYGFQPGYATYMASGTNHDWARIVLVAAGWPVTESNVTVITRWMRQENYIDSWWNRNNPLNNGWGSGGGGGLGRYNSLLDAAMFAAKALKTHPGYAAIAAGFARSAPTHEIEAAIWASPWASGHYNNGKHWHYTPVPVVTAPPSAWG